MTSKTPDERKSQRDAMVAKLEWARDRVKQAETTVGIRTVQLRRDRARLDELRHQVESLEVAIAELDGAPNLEEELAERGQAP